MWKGSSSSNKQAKKQVRKPISSNFSPKRLAINFQPPTLILQYLVIDTGKLYHHKMRLDSVLRKPNVSRTMVLDYVKTKHHLYFVNTKIKDQQILKFIDKILYKLGKSKGTVLQKITQKSNHLQSSPQNHNHNNYNHNYNNNNDNNDDDFDYLNDDDEYEQDYQDYQQQTKQVKKNKQNNINLPQSSFSTKKNMIPKTQSNNNNNNNNNNKNTFMTYCQQQYDDDNQQEQQANWDLDIDQNADFDFV